MRWKRQRPRCPTEAGFPVSRRFVLFLLLGISGAYLLACFGLAKLYVSPPRGLPPHPAEFSRIVLPDHEPLWVSPGLSSDKARGKALFVMVHGYRGNVGHFAELGRRLVDQGYEVILTELAGHGDSPDAHCGFGTRESDVVVEATRWGRAKFSKPPRVVLVGVSMGGAAAWLASAKAPELFDAVATEGAFARLDEVTDSWFDRILPQGHVAFWPVKGFASYLSGIDSSKVNPIDAAHAWNGRPALVIHCADDDLMKPSYARDLAEASGARTWTIPNAAHAQGCAIAEDEYLVRLTDLAKLLGRPQAVGLRRHP